MSPKAICIRCDKELQRSKWADLGLDDPPLGGIYLSSYGNYGSTIFDSYDDHERLECYLCDECLKANSEKIYVQNKNEFVTIEEVRRLEVRTLKEKLNDNV
jgi:hypothetical protein